MILHIPHSGVDTLGININNKDLIRGTDWYTDELFSHSNSDRLVQKYSRFVVDCERLPNDIEPLFKDGYGLRTTKDFDGNDLVNLPDEEVVNKIYNDYHKKLNNLTAFTLCYIPKVFVVDCHSFGDSQIISDVDFCLGINDDFDDFELLRDIEKYLESNGFNVGVNTPYSNAIVPNRYYDNSNVKSLMIEVNKRLYLNEYVNSVEKSENFSKTKQIITNILALISQKEQTYDD